MNNTLLVLVIAVLVMLVVIGLVAAFAGGRGLRLRPLTDESRERFAREWRMVEARFIEDPPAAVQEADKMALKLLGERGAKLDDKRMPNDLRRARDAAASGQGSEGTESMRQAMVHYKHIVDSAVGAELMRPETGRREVAS